MKGKDLARWGLLAAVCLSLYGWGASWRGLIGPDEPRYASIAREMAVSGDWVTPRLWGEPWFEKPALLYWIGAAATVLGLDDDRATRAPLALLSFLFLVYFHRRLREASDEVSADVATAVLATSAGWVAFSQAGVFDLPVAAAAGAALLELLPWVRDPSDKRRLPWFGAWLGVGLLAKGLVAPAIALVALAPLIVRRGLGFVARDLLRPRVLMPFIAVACPWYLLCYARNGSVFVTEFLWKHHVMRFVSPELQHVQPWWFYLPVALVALAPWTPLLAVRWERRRLREPMTSFLIAWGLGAIVLFSVAANKLPGYLLPALPAFAALIGLRHRDSPRAAWYAAAGLLMLFPVAESLLAPALADGLGDAWPPRGMRPAAIVAFGLLAAAAAVAVRVGRRRTAALALAAGATVGFILLKIRVFPDLDRVAGSRAVWRSIATEPDRVCLEKDVRRHVAYGLAYYNGGPLPACAEQPRPKRVKSHPPQVVETSMNAK